MAYQQFNKQRFNIPKRIINNTYSTGPIGISDTSNFMSALLRLRAINGSYIDASTLTAQILHCVGVSMNLQDISSTTMNVLRNRLYAMQLMDISDMTVSSLRTRLTSTSMQDASTLDLHGILRNKLTSTLLQDTSIFNNASVLKYCGLTANLQSLSTFENTWIAKQCRLFVDITDISQLTNSAIIRYRETATNMYDTSKVDLAYIRGRLTNSTFNAESNISIDLLPILSEVINSDARQFRCRVEIYVDPNNPIILTENDVEGFELLEELKADTENPVGDITANEFSLTVDNVDRRYSAYNVDSDLYGKLLPGIKVKPHLQLVLKNDIMLEFPLGTFYTSDWNAPAQNILCDVTCYDRLHHILNLPFNGLRIFKNTTIKDLYVAVFTAAGLTRSDYQIDEALNIPVDIAFIPKGTIGTALRALSEASGSYVMVNRNDVIKVSIPNYTGAIVTKITDDNQLIDASLPIQYLETYAAINIPYYLNDLKKGIQVLSIADMDITTGMNTFKDLNFTNVPIEQITKIELKAPSTVSLKYYVATAETITLYIENTGAACKADISIYGNSVEFIPTKVSKEYEQLFPAVNKKELKIENTLIQSKSFVDTYIDKLAVITSNPGSKVTLEIRGDSRILPDNIIELSDKTKNISAQKVLVTRSILRFQGSLSGTLDGYRIP